MQSKNRKYVQYVVNATSNTETVINYMQLQNPST